MFKNFTLLSLLCATMFFGGYAYFLGSNILEIPDSKISFVASDMDKITLTIYELEIDAVKLFTQAEELPISKIVSNAKKHVYQRTFTITDKWQEFSLEFEEIGVYLAVLTGFEKSEKTTYDAMVLIVTDMGIVFVADEEKAILGVVKTTGGFLENVAVYLLKGNKVIGKMKTDENGLVRIDKDFDFALVKKEKSLAFCRFYRTRRSIDRDEKLFLLTDRPIYKPGDTVNLRGQLFKLDGSYYTALGASRVTVKIEDPKNNEIYSKTLSTDELGGFWDSFDLAETSSVGNYTIKVEHNERDFYETFLVEEYRKPEYKMEILPDKEKYISGEPVDFTIKVNYFNGQPVAGAQVALYVNADPIEQSEYLVYRAYELTDESGQVKISLKTEEGFEGYYTLQAIVADESQRQIEQEKSIYIYADNVKISVDRDYIFAKPGESVELKIFVSDLNGNPLSGQMSVLIGENEKTLQVDDGKAILKFSPDKIGSFKIQLSFQKARKSIYVHSYAWAKGYKISEFAVVTDKEKYKPGEKITVQLFSPSEVSGIIALTADTIYDLKPFSLKDHSTVEFTIPENVIERNLFLIFLAYENGRRIMDNLKIAIERDLNVEKAELYFDRESYKPGETAKLTIKSKNDGVFCLTIVDEAIYSMIGFNPAQIEEVIYPQNNYPDVTWSFSQRWFYIDLANLKSTGGLYSMLPEPTTFEDFKRSAVEAKINVREYFPDTALWIPQLRTKNKTATVEFKIPDSITNFIATAYGFSTKSMMQANSSFVVTKDFYVTPHLPSFLREGDVMQISATVHNQTSDILKTRLWLELPETVKLISPDQSLSIFDIVPKISNTSYWTINALKESDLSTITTYAVSHNDLKDAVALNIPVKPFAFEREFYVLEFVDGVKEISLPQSEYKTAKLRIFSNIIPLVEDSIRHLIKYPYGCTEQTMSSFLPAVIASQMGLKIEDLEDIVRKGLMRLYKYQKYDGGWGWWQTDDSNNFMTCYVMEGLYYAKKAGIEVASSVINSGINYLKENLSAYGVYVLDLYKIPHESYTPQKDIDWIYLSFSNEKALDEALKLVHETEKFAYVDQVYDFFTSDVQLTSILLRALTKWGKHEGLQRKIINYLFSKKDGYFWYSTKDTSFAVLALLEVLPGVENPHLVIENGSKVVELDTEGELSLQKEDLKIKGKGLVEVHVVYYESPVGSVSDGIEVKRDFFKRYEILIKNEKSIIDAFIPINQDYIPVSVELLEELKNGEIYISAFDDGKYSYRGTTFTVNGNKLSLNEMEFEFERLETFDGLILVIMENAAMVYDTKTQTAKTHFGTSDANLTKMGTVYLKDGKLWINDELIVMVPQDVKSLSCSKDEILLKSERGTYWFKEGRFTLLPFIAERILSWDGKELICDKGFTFSGNDELITVSPCKVTFSTGTVSVNSGDIMKTIIYLENGSGNYIVVEDYFPSCAQILQNYNERSLQSYSKFDYMWYRSWENWYLAREIYEDRIAFFTYKYLNGRMSYVWRATANGKYRILPTQAYSMYYKGLYAHSDPDVLNIGFRSEGMESE